MSLKGTLKWLFGLVVLAAIGAFLAWVYVEGRKESPAEKEGEKEGGKEASRVAVEGGESVIKLTKEVQEKSGITSVSLTKTSSRTQERVYGTVVDLQELIDLRANCISAKAQLEKARASLDASRKEFERLKRLYESNRNVSDKALQAAEAAWRSDEAGERAAQGAVQALEPTARQKWGAVLTGWALESTPNFERLVQQQDVLIQLTLGAGEALSAPPATALVQDVHGKLVSADLVSPAPRTDPRIQGMSFFYKAPQKTSGLLPGMNAMGYLATGPEIAGVVIPVNALVSWQGKMWAYVRKGEEQFVRREVPTEMPVPEGWFVTKGFSPGDHVVVTGPQLLLSEEFRSQIQAEEE